MNIKQLTFGIFLGLIFGNCQKKDTFPGRTEIESCTSPLVESGKVYELSGRKYLWAGQDSSWHFDITGWSLEECQLHDYGFQRESFAALVDAAYVPLFDVADKFGDLEKVIWVDTETGRKVYPYTTMTDHEVINETFDGNPVMIAYCHLADLAAVYTRDYCNKTLTFGVSGYTYSDEYVWDGLRGFVLWDRETESLWWPLIDQAVSGKMKDTFLRKYRSQSWGYARWGEIIEQYPNALVLKPGQEWQVPESWPGYACSELECCSE